MDGTALILCEGAFGTTSGKTANGLVRYCKRYKIAGVIDSQFAGRDAGEVLDGISRNIPVYASLDDALKKSEKKIKYLLIGLAPDGGRLPPTYRNIIKRAIRMRLNVDSGLHDFLSEDIQLSKLAKQYGVKIRDVRKPPARNKLHFYSGKIEQVKSVRIAILGTDSAVGKRTTAILLNEELRSRSIKSEIIGTGQTSWMQGIKYCIILDSIVNDFVAGEIEHIIWKAWHKQKPDIMLLEGQGNLTNPAYPGGFELLAAGKPHAIILQHAPARTHYDGFPNIPIGDLSREIQILRLLAGAPILAVTLNPEGMSANLLKKTSRECEHMYGVPAIDVSKSGCSELLSEIFKKFPALEQIAK